MEHGIEREQIRVEAVGGILELSISQLVVCEAHLFGVRKDAPHPDNAEGDVEIGIEEDYDAYFILCQIVKHRSSAFRK